MTAPRRANPIYEWILEHPRLDYALPLVLILAGAIFHNVPTPTDNDRLYLVAGVSTVAGLVMTAATFVCTLTYQSSNVLMNHVRLAYATTLRRNWVSIIVRSFVAAIAPVCTLAFAFPSWVAVAASLVSLVLICQAFARAVFWMVYTLFMQDASSARPQIEAPELSLPELDNA